MIGRNGIVMYIICVIMLIQTIAIAVLYEKVQNVTAGPQGVQGVQGKQGLKGAVGSKGAAGRQGSEGPVCTDCIRKGIDFSDNQLNALKKFSFSGDTVRVPRLEARELLTFSALKARNSGQIVTSIENEGDMMETD